MTIFMGQIVDGGHIWAAQGAKLARNQHAGALAQELWEAALGMLM